MRCTILKSTESHHSTPCLVSTIHLHHEDKLCDAAIKQQTCISLLVMKTINELRTSNDLPCIIIYLSPSHVHKSWDEISVFDGIWDSPWYQTNVEKGKINSTSSGYKVVGGCGEQSGEVAVVTRLMRLPAAQHVTRDTWHRHTAHSWHTYSGLRSREARFSDYWWDIQMEANCILILMIRLAGIV